MRYFLIIFLTLASITQASAQTVTPEQQNVIGRAFRVINVRSGPGTGYDIIGYLEEGSVINIYGRNDANSNWLLVDYENNIGWVAFFTVSIEGNPDTLPIVDINIDTLPAASSTLRTPLNEAESNLFVSTYRRVNVRSGPGTEFPVLGVLSPGESADVIGSSGDDHEWLQIDYDGKSGWVAFFVVQLTGDIEELVTTTSIGQITSTINNTVEIQQPLSDLTVITRFNTNLREDAHFRSQILEVIPYQTTLTATARTEDDVWIRVAYDELEGWILLSLVSTGAGDIKALPIFQTE